MTSWLQGESRDGSSTSTLVRVRASNRTDRTDQYKQPLFGGLGNSEWGFETILERSDSSERCDKSSLRECYETINRVRPAIEMFSGRRWDKLPTVPQFRKLIKSREWSDQFFTKIPEFYEYLVCLRHREPHFSSAARADAAGSVHRKPGVNGGKRVSVVDPLGNTLLLPAATGGSFPGGARGGCDIGSCGVAFPAA